MPRYSLLDENKVLTLIEEVKKRELLYNNNVNTDQQYSVKFAILKGWAEIAAKLEKPEKIVKLKWRSLRDSFWKEVRRCGPPETYSGQWQFFKPLSFIYKPRQKPAIAAINVSDDDSERGEPEYLEEEAETVSNFINTERVGDFEVICTEDPLTRIETDNGGTRKSNHSETQEEDFDVMFLTSLTPYFKQLEPLRKLVVRSKIQDMLLTELSAQMCSNRNKS